MRRFLRFWLLLALLVYSVGLSAGTRNVILILCNGVNLAQLELAKQIGADVPFCLVNQTARVQGIGEKIRVLSQKWKLSCLIVKISCRKPPMRSGYIKSTS